MKCISHGDLLPSPDDSDSLSVFQRVTNLLCTNCARSDRFLGELINGMFSFMGQNVLLATRKQFHVHDWERGRERWTEEIWGFMREKQGRETRHEKGRKFYTTIRLTQTDLPEVKINDSTHTHLIRHCL